MKIGDYPNLDELVLLARQYAPELLLAAVEIAQTSSSDSTRLKAIDLVLQRGYGKAGSVATQTVPNQLDHMTPQERIKALEDALIEEKLKLAQGMTPENKKKDAEA